MIKKLILGAVAVTVAGLVTPAAAQQNIVIGASSVGGSYYLYSGGVATLVNRNTDDLVATARTTRGSVENVSSAARRSNRVRFLGRRQRLPDTDRFATLQRGSLD